MQEIVESEAVRAAHDRRILIKSTETLTSALSLVAQVSSLVSRRGSRAKPLLLVKCVLVIVSPIFLPPHTPPVDHSTCTHAV